MIDAALKSVLDAAQDISDDSRLIAPGTIFFAMQGHRRHGFVGVDEAVQRGAHAIVHDGKIDEVDRAHLAKLKLPVIEQPALKEQLPVILKYFWKDPQQHLRLHAVTGTNGKSSVAWLLSQTLGGAMIGTIGVGRPGHHHPSAMTTPSIFSVYRHLAEFRHQGIQEVVIEASSHALIQDRLAGLSFESTIFTNLGHDHLDYHGDRQAYGAAKAKLFRDFDAKLQLFNLDDAFGQALFDEQCRAHVGDQTCVMGYALNQNPGAGIFFSDRPDRASGSSVGVQGTVQWADDGSMDVCTGLIGQVNVYNLLICAAVAKHCGLDDSRIGDQLSKLTPPPGRMEIIGDWARDRQRQAPMVVVDYAHSPDALKEALMMLRAVGQGQLWCVFGCGGDRDASKRAPMGRIAESIADRVVLTDDNPRHESSLAIVRAIQSGMRQPERARVILDRTQAIDTAIELAGIDDIVLIAGKGHETEQVVGDRRLPLDDRQLARQAWLRRLDDQQEAC